MVNVVHYHADASSRAAVAASAAAAAVAVTKAAAARAAAKVRRRAGKELAAKGGNGARPEWSKDNGARPRKGYVFYSISILEFPLCMVAKTFQICWNLCSTSVEAWRLQTSLSWGCLQEGVQEWGTAGCVGDHGLPEGHHAGGPVPRRCLQHHRG